MPETEHPEMNFDDGFFIEEWLEDEYIDEGLTESASQFTQFSQSVVDQSSNFESHATTSVTPDITSCSKDIIHPVPAISPATSTISSGVSSCTPSVSLSKSSKKRKASNENSNIDAIEVIADVLRQPIVVQSDTATNRCQIL